MTADELAPDTGHDTTRGAQAPTPTGFGNAPSEARIESIAAETIVVPLPRPIQLGPMFIAEREYAVVRVVTTEGLTGCAFVNTRGAPIAAIVNSMIAPALVDQPSELIDAAWKRANSETIAAGRSGAILRALSIVDIALWDAKGKRAGVPVWRLLGGGQPKTECLRVGGYPTGESADVMAERIGELADVGHRVIKLARIYPPAAFKELLDKTYAAIGDKAQLVIDTHWSWRRADEAAREIRAWDVSPAVAWVEDPLAPEDVDGYTKLVNAGVSPIGVGDEMTDRHAAYGLLTRAAVDVLRIDATTIGGITGAWHMTHVAQAAGTRVSYHIYPEVHVHLAAAGAADGMTESFGPADNPFDPAGRIYAGGPVYTPGFATATDAPGLGIDLDEEFIAAHRVGGRVESSAA